MTATIFQGQGLSELALRPVARGEQARYQAQMAQHHYLGDLPKIGETLWYVATWREQWVAQLSVSAAALKCGVRDRWIGWDFRTQFDRLKRVGNNSRFLILPEGRWPNLGSKVLSLLERRIGADWQREFGHRLLLLETFVEPLSHPKKVGSLPVTGSDERKRINEIGMAIPLLEQCGIAGRDITADALLTQRALATYIVDFPHVGQVFLIEREVIIKKTGEQRCEIALGITSRTPDQASPERLLAINRGHWRIESTHYIIDWNYDEDRSRIRTGNGPENVTRLRRFAVGILKSFQKPRQSIAQMMRQLAFQPRRVLDYLRLTANSLGLARTAR